MSSSSSWIFAIDEYAIQENSMSVAFPNGIPVLIIRREGEIYAISNKCAHMECPLSGGTLEGDIIQCPCHDWRFNIKTGEFVDAKEIKIPVFATKNTDGKIFIKLEGENK